MSDGDKPARAGKTCIYPGCDRPAVPAHLLGGPQPSFCDLEEHTALTAHQERRRLARPGADPGAGNRESVTGGGPQNGQ